MKKVLFLLTAAVLLTVSSCSFLKNGETFVQQHCTKSLVYDSLTKEVVVYYQCDSLYNTKTVIDKCHNVEVCFDAAQASSQAYARCYSEFDASQFIKDAIAFVKKVFLKKA